MRDEHREVWLSVSEEFKQKIQNPGFNLFNAKLIFSQSVVSSRHILNHERNDWPAVTSQKPAGTQSEAERRETYYFTANTLRYTAHLQSMRIIAPN